MKKSFLLFSAISIFVAANAQDRSVALHRVAKNHMAAIDQGLAVPGKTVAIPNTKASSVEDIATPYNLYGILGNRQNQIVYNPDINTVAFVHRQNNGGPGAANVAKGIMSLDYSKDGGTTWTVNPYQTTPTGSGPTWNGNRYPNMGIYNPPGNTNPDNAIMLSVGPNLETGAGSNDNGWAQTFRVSFKLDGTSIDETYDANSISTLGDKNEWGAGGFYVTSQGTAWYVSTNTNNSGATPNASYDVADNYSKYFIVRGDYDAVNVKFDWTVVDTITPGWNTTLSNGTAFNMGGLMNMAWSVDGNTGYVVMMGSWGANTMWRPYVLKTTDAGATWNNVNDYDFSNEALLQCQILPASDQTIRPWFSDFDMVVDSADELRIFCQIQSGSSPHPDSLAFAYTAPQTTGLYEATTNGTGWDLVWVDSIYVEDHEYDAVNQLTHFVRPQASRSQDGSKLFYTWIGSDPTFSAAREYPDVHSRGHEIATDLWTPITNLSALNGSNYIASYPTMSVEVIENGAEKAWELPIVYAHNFTSQLTDGTVPCQYSYLRGVGFDQADFTETAIADPCLGVGLAETKIVAQEATVYPNPTNGVIAIRLTDVSEFNYTIVDVLGNVVTNNIVSGNYTSIDLSNNAKGVYFVTIETENNSVTKKVMLTK